MIELVVGAEVLLADPARVRSRRTSGRCPRSPARTTSPGATCCRSRRRTPTGCRVSWRPWIAASAWSGVFMMCDQSTSVVIPALMHSSAPQRFAAIDVVRPVVRRELVEDRAEVRDQRVVRRAGPDRRLPGVAVGVDEARDDDVARPRRSTSASAAREVPADRRDLVALDQDVGARQLADARGPGTGRSHRGSGLRSATAMLPSRCCVPPWSLPCARGSPVSALLPPG